MAEEAQGNALDSVFENVAQGIQTVITPSDESIFTENFYLSLFTLSGFVAWVGEWCISRGALLVSLFIPLLFAAQILQPHFSSLAWGWLLMSLPLLGPVALIASLWKAWVWYIQRSKS